MKAEDIIVGKEYFVDLDHEDSYAAFSGDVDVYKRQIVKVRSVYKDSYLVDKFDISIPHITYEQTIGIGCFIKPI